MNLPAGYTKFSTSMRTMTSGDDWCDSSDVYLGVHAGTAVLEYLATVLKL